MDETAKKLVSETVKWKEKIEQEIKKTRCNTKKSKELMDNIKAYVKDSGYFLEKKDYVRAFEAIIWAWALYETGKRENILMDDQ